jgi:hypothetical protein
MTLYELLSLVVSTAGFVTVIITLALLMRQTREMAAQSKYVAESLKDSVHESATDRGFAVGEIFINHPEMRPYFYSSKEISEDDPAYNKVIAVADVILDHFDSILIRSQDFPQASLRQSWEGYMVDAFAISPVLCKHLTAIKDWHSDDLIAKMKEGEAKRLRRVQVQTTIDN